MPHWSRSPLLITPACAGSVLSGRAGLKGDETLKDACGYRSLRHFRLVSRGVVLFGVKLRKTAALCQLPLPYAEKVSFTPEFLTHGRTAAVFHSERRKVAYTSVSHVRCLGSLVRHRIDVRTARDRRRSTVAGTASSRQERISSRTLAAWNGRGERLSKKCHLSPNF